MTEVYSGSTQEGWNKNGSFNRIIFHNYSTLFSHEKISPLIQDGIKTVNNSNASRLLLRVMCERNEIQKILALKKQFPEIEIAYYPGIQNTYYVTLGYNKPERRIENTLRSKIHHQICSAHQTEIPKSDEHRIITPEEGIDPKKLAHIWNVFGWTEQECKKAIQENSLIFGLQNATGEMIGAMLLDEQIHSLKKNGKHHRVKLYESTEWAILPEFRKKHLMNWFHSNVLKKAKEFGVEVVWGEFRTPDPSEKRPHSISASLASGIEFCNQSDILTHHVSIGGENNSYHTEKSPFKIFRNFLPGSKVL